MKLSQEVLEVLSACNVHANSVQITAGQLDRELYLKVNEALEALGGKWNRKAKAHMFEADPVDALDNAILTGEVERAKDLDFFPTPKGIACEMVAMLGNIKGAHVLEPSAGEGAIAQAIVEAGGLPWCVELNVKRHLHLRTHVPQAICAAPQDFMAMKPLPEAAFDSFDFCAMNPPFSKRQDIFHVSHALKFLKRGGKLVSVMSAGVTFRKDKLTTVFRETIEDCGGVFHKLPPGPFKASGTDVNAVILEVVK